METSMPTGVLEAIEGSEVIVLEGFDMTGKSWLAGNIHQMFPASMIYRPDWEGSLNDEVLRRGNRGIPGIVILDFWRDLKASGCFKEGSKLIIDRWLAVNIVYRRLYNQPNDCDSEEAIIRSHIRALGDLRMLILHKTHASSSESTKIFDLVAGNPMSHNDIYDKFDGYSGYMDRYREFEQHYDNFYKEDLARYSAGSKIGIIKLSSLSNDIVEVLR